MDQVSKQILTDIHYLLLSESTTSGNLKSVSKNHSGQVTKTREEDQTSKDDLPAVQVERIDRDCCIKHRIISPKISVKGTFYAYWQTR